MEAKESLAAAKDTMRTIEDESVRVEALIEIIRLEVRRSLEEAKATAQSIEGSWNIDKA